MMKQVKVWCRQKGTALMESFAAKRQPKVSQSACSVPAPGTCLLEVGYLLVPCRVCLGAKVAPNGDVQ
jgi:hypothetical protein